MAQYFSKLICEPLSLYHFIIKKTIVMEQQNKPGHNPGQEDNQGYDTNHGRSAYSSSSTTQGGSNYGQGSHQLAGGAYRQGSEQSRGSDYANEAGKLGSSSTGTSNEGSSSPNKGAAETGRPSSPEQPSEGDAQETSMGRGGHGGYDADREQQEVNREREDMNSERDLDDIDVDRPDPKEGDQGTETPRPQL